MQVYVSQLRRILGNGSQLETRAPGYSLVVESRLDAVEFERLLASARAARKTQPAEAIDAYDEALRLWRGSVLADTTLEGDALLSAARLEELRLVATEERIDLALDLGQHRELIPELELLVAAEPLRERFRAQLMLRCTGPAGKPKRSPPTVPRAPI